MAASGAEVESGALATVPEQLALGPGKGVNPYPVGDNGVGMPAPKGLRVEMAMSPGQTDAGEFGTMDHIPDVEFVRKNLAVRDDWKAEISHVQVFEIPEGMRIQVGRVGPQELGDIKYPGGANQVQILDPEDRKLLIPIGEPRPIK